MAEFRLFLKDGCSSCELAKAWAMGNQDCPVEMWRIGNDPVLNAGVEKFGGTPVLISFLTNEYVVGFNPNEYERLRKLYLERSSPSSFRVAGAEVNNSGATARVAEVETPTDARIVDLFHVSGDVVDTNNSAGSSNGDGVPVAGVSR